jgi:hypothetical protein
MRSFLNFVDTRYDFFGRRFMLALLGASSR